MIFRVLSVLLGLFLCIGGAVFIITSLPGTFIDILTSINFVILSIIFFLYGFTGEKNIRTLVRKLYKP